MIRVTVELVPYGDDLYSQVIARGHIWNDGWGTPEIAHYGATFLEKFRQQPGNVPPFYPNQEGVTGKRSDATLKDFKRQEHGALRLLYEVLRKIYEPSEKETEPAQGTVAKANRRRASAKEQAPTPEAKAQG